MAVNWREIVRTERVEFTNMDGERLSGLLDVPREGEPLAFAVFSHCFTCTKRYKIAVHLGRLLAQRGIGLLRYDFPGLGDSEGDFSQTTFQGYVRDVRSAASFMQREYASPRVLMGHSFGGGATLAAAGAIEGVDLVVTFAATARPAELRPQFRVADEEAQATGLGRLETNGVQHELRKEFFDTLRNVTIEPSVRALQPRLLAVHAPEDSTVSFDNAEDLVRWAPRSELLRLEGAGHLFAREAHVTPVVDRIVELLDTSGH